MNVRTVGLVGTLVACVIGCSTDSMPEAARQSSAPLLDASACPAGSNVIFGTVGDDVLVGTSGADCILGGGGNDTISGGNGDDTLVGGAGDDTLVGGEGKDTLYGEDGNDQLDGGNAQDKLYGGADNDILKGGNGADRLEGGTGNDVLAGGEGADVLLGNDGDDAIDSGNGADDVSGGAGNDACGGAGCEAAEGAVPVCVSDAECAAGARCTSAGVCVFCLGNAECSDANGCTIDVCTPLVGCDHDAIPDGTLCLDDTVCNGQEVCQAGVCAAGTPLTCDDALFCNGTEGCDASNGCTSGTPPEMDDGDECTVDSCDEDSDSIEHTRDDFACGKLWGWADLHAHPASHLGFGADSAGSNGMFWGKPGMGLEDSYGTLLADHPACAPDKHGSFDADLVRHLNHVGMIGMTDNISGFAHEANGADSFSNWPNARSLTHQQMHITAIRRAYEGGLRLMVASVTDNQFLSRMWSEIGYNALGNPVPLNDPNYDFESARRQLRFIKDLVTANSGWMEVALSAGEARDIVLEDKLAIILSLEMDSLSPAQTLQLVHEEGVRQVIPVHLIDNDVGGTALYTDVFNTVNAFVHATRDTGNWNQLHNDGWFEVEYDPLLSGRLGRPLTLIAEGANLIQGGAIWPRPIGDSDFAALGYEAAASDGGHKNALGITDAGKMLIRSLAREGVLIDVAHMGEKTTSWVLAEFAREHGYPVMDSHTGLREADESAENERALMRAHAGIIAELGGVIGLGTEGTAGMMPILTEPRIPNGNDDDPLVRFTGEYLIQDWSLALLPGNPLVTNLTVTLKTGGDDLRGGNNRVWARVDLPSGIFEVDLSEGATWPGGAVRTVSFALPGGTHADDILAFGLRTAGNLDNQPTDDPDNWDLDELKVMASVAGMDTVGTWLSQYEDVRSLLGGRGVALGTDINGFAPQIPFAASPVSYPLTVASRSGNPRSPALPRAEMGTRTFEFHTDGIAHYGLLSDFMQALDEQPDSDEAVDALFHSAGDVIEMWEACEAAAVHIP